MTDVFFFFFFRISPPTIQDKENAVCIIKIYQGIRKLHRFEQRRSKNFMYQKSINCSTWIVYWTEYTSSSSHFHLPVMRWVPLEHSHDM